MSTGSVTHAHTARPRSRAVLIGVGAIVGLVAFALTRVIWPDPVGASEPPANLLPGFMVLAALESLLFGLGVVFLLAGFGPVRRSGRRPVLSWAAYVGIAWMLLSWWPHDNLHRVLGHDNWSGLLGIEYGFHVTLIVASIVVATYFIDTLRSPR
jgi:hypothetical protein